MVINVQEKKQQALFPDLPSNRQLVDQQGNITSNWRLFFDQLTTALQTNYKPEGIVVASKTASEIALLTDATKSTANILYDSTNNQFKGNIAGTWKTFTLT